MPGRFVQPPGGSGGAEGSSNRFITTTGGAFSDPSADRQNSSRLPPQQYHPRGRGGDRAPHQPWRGHVDRNQSQFNNRNPSNNAGRWNNRGRNDVPSRKRRRSTSNGSSRGSWEGEGGMGGRRSRSGSESDLPSSDDDNDHVSESDALNDESSLDANSSNSSGDESGSDGGSSSRSGSTPRERSGRTHSHRRITFEGSVEDDAEHGESQDPKAVASAITQALANDLNQCQTCTTAIDQSTDDASPSLHDVNDKTCCICREPALYTCPGCKRRTCSVTCVRVHKTQHSCSGERSVSAKIPLSQFTDGQLKRDFHFLEDVRRVVNNAERGFEHIWRFSFKALPPPLHSLRTAAKKRGVVCQITSEGMHKRIVNTSRYDRRSDTIVWRCEFNFTDAEGTFTVGTDWGSERFLLKDVLAYSWALNPTLPSFHINRQYNRASQWIEGKKPKPGKADGEVSSAVAPASGVETESGNAGETTHEKGEGAHDETADGVEGGEENRSNVGTADKPDGDKPLDAQADISHHETPPTAAESTPEIQESNNNEQNGMEAADGEKETEDGAPTPRGEASNTDLDEHPPSEDKMERDSKDVVENAQEKKRHKSFDTSGVQALSSWDGMISVGDLATPHNEEEEKNRKAVCAFLAAGPVEILVRAERLASEIKYFRMNPNATLNESLRTLFFVNEFPVFEVVHREAMENYDIVTEDDKELIRESFRAKDYKREKDDPRQPRRTKADFTPEELERYARIPCRQFLGGRCRQAAGDCPYWHCTYEEVPGCRHFAKFGACPMEGRCCFRHDAEAIAAERRRSRQEDHSGPGRGRGGRGRGFGFGGRAQGHGRGFGGPRDGPGMYGRGHGPSPMAPRREWSDRHNERE